MDIYLQDIMPTAIEYAGGEVPEYVEFSSLKELIDKERKTSNHHQIYGAYKDRQRMLRDGDYKLIVYPQAGVKRLFNLAEDPHEMRDLAGKQEQQQRISDMFNSLIELQESMDDTLDLAAYNWN